MGSISLPRLYFLRAVYLIVGVGAGSLSWPGLLAADQTWTAADGFVASMIGAMSLLCFLGLRYPLRMLPVLFWEVVWKLIWLARIALPMWRADQLDEGTIANIFACGLVVIVIAAIPWDYVYSNYLRQPGDPWKRK